MNINEEYAIELLLDSHLKGREIGNGYIVAYMSECKITNPEKLDKWLLTNGYLRKPTVEETLSQYKVPELKKLLSEKGSKVTGKKAELIERIMPLLSEQDIATISESDKRYFLSEKGLRHYYDNIDLTEFHRNVKYRISLNEYFKHRKLNGITRNFYETAYLIIKKRIEKNNRDIANPYRLTNTDFSSFSEICEKLALNDEAIKSVLMKVYLETNLIDRAPFDKDVIKIHGIEEICEELQDVILFNLHTTQRIVSLSRFYSEYMVDDIYATIKLQYTVFGKEDFKRAIEDMIQSAYFDPSPYVSIIKDNYRCIAKKILNNKNTLGFTSIFNFWKRHF